MDELIDFDLATDSWITVVDLKGDTQELGLLACLERAHDLREIVDPSPLVVFGIHRFLAAVLQAYLPVGDEDQWAALWVEGRFGPEFVEKVRGGCTGRLSIFDPNFPFYQSGDIPSAGVAPGDLKTVGYLFPEESTGTNVVHFSHPGDARHAYCPICCTKGLLIQTPFATSGGAGIKPSINGVPPMYVLPAADNLFATLLLNYVLPQFQPSLAARPDPGPLWESSSVVPKREERASVGFVESLTWPPRRIRLLPDDDGTCSRCGKEARPLVRRMVYVQGLSRRKDLPVWQDPWVAYMETPQTGNGVQADRMPVRPREGRGVWRDFPSLFLSSRGARAGGTWHRPAVLEQLATLLHEECVPPDLPVRYETFALRTDGKAKLFEWRQDLFDFPPAILPSAHAAAAVQQALGLAQGTERCLAFAIRQLHPISKRERPNKDALRSALQGLVGQASREYWQGMELPFRQAVCDEGLVGNSAQRRDWLLAWWESARASATDVLERILESFDEDADDLRDQVAARRVFYGGLKRLMESEFKLEVTDGES